MTIQGTVEKTSATARSNINSKSSTKSVQIKKPGITVKRKLGNPTAGTSPSVIAIPPAKKKKKSSISSGISNSNSNSKSVKSAATPPPVASFDLELTLCPICDEACTCPKTTTSSIIVKSPNSNKKTLSNELISKKPVNKKKNINNNSNSSSSSSKREKPKFVKKYEISEEDSESEEYFEEESEGENSAVVEDPALSFIRMIYSDEESLDEEEAYALYQATQLFSSSSDEEEIEYFEQSQGEVDDNEESYDEESGNSDQDFEYTVVEYVQPFKKQVKKSSEFVAYESGDDEIESSEESQDQTNLLLNAEGPEIGDSDISSESSSLLSSEGEGEGDDDENWLTYSVFDVDRDLALNGSSCTSLSSHGSGTPDTLLFSTSSTDKIPNIAPQVLAAISAAAKHMANQRSYSSSSNADGSSSKYFSYITLRDPLRSINEEVNEEEFLFFEETATQNESDEEIIEEDCSSISDVISDEELEDISVEDSDEFESFSEDCSSNESITEIILPAIKKIIKTPTIAAPIPVSTSTSTEYFNRWNRVPIGAFRRSRRPSIPAFHPIHPSTALKTFSTDPANFAISGGGGEDSFDESSVTPMERSYSVVTWDELDIDINGNTSRSPMNSSSGSGGTNTGDSCPLPKRSRSFMLPSTSSNSLVNNFEWLNNNWNWEI